MEAILVKKEDSIFRSALAGKMFGDRGCPKEAADSIAVYRASMARIRRADRLGGRPETDCPEVLR